MVAPQNPGAGPTTETGGERQPPGGTQSRGISSRGEKLTALLGILLYLTYVGALATGWWAVYRSGYDGIQEAAVMPSTPGALTILKLAPDSPFHRAGLRAGDMILSTDGVAAADPKAFTQAMQASQAGDERTMRVRHPTGPEDDMAVVLQSQLARPGLVIELVVNSVVGMLFVVVGGGVALARPGDPAARLLLLGGGALAALMATLTWLTTGGSTALIGRAAPLSFILSTTATLHLFLSFPADHPLLRRLRALGPAALRRIGGGVGVLYIVPLAVTLGLLLGPARLWDMSYLRERHS